MTDEEKLSNLNQAYALQQQADGLTRRINEAKGTLKQLEDALTAVNTRLETLWKQFRVSIGSGL